MNHNTVYPGNMNALKFLLINCHHTFGTKMEKEKIAGMI
jgi:hypothetical protein